MESDQKIKKEIFTYGGWAIIVAILIIIITGMYQSGYRLGGGKLVKAGSIILKNVPSETITFVDGKQVNTSLVLSTPPSIKLGDITPGNHSILVSKDGYLPWMKKVVLPIQGNITLSPFLLPKNAGGEIVTAKDPEYNKLLNLISKNNLPTKQDKKISKDGKVGIYVEGKTLHASWLPDNENPPTVFCVPTCVRDVTVLTGVVPIKNIEFYGDRNDVILFSAEKNISGIEIDKNEIQNFEPTWTGTNPHFFKESDNTLYIEDSNTLYHIAI